MGYFFILIVIFGNLDGVFYVFGGLEFFDLCYIGNKVLDICMGIFIGFFSGLVNGERNWDVDFVYVWIMGMFFFGWVLVSVEVYWRVNRGRVVSWWVNYFLSFFMI